MKRMVAVLMVVAAAGCVHIPAMVGGSRPVTPNKKIVLWNGTDFAGWKLIGRPGPKKDPNGIVREFSPGDPGCEWSIGDGVIKCKGVPSGYMRTTTAYANYKLHVEWRWPGEAGNSGVLIHMSGQDKIWPNCIECQLKSGNAGDFYVQATDFKEHKQLADGGKRTPHWGESAEKPLGQWNRYDIICRDNTITVYVNGQLKNRATETTVSAGKICLQSEGSPIEFRNIYIEPLG